MLPRPLEAAQCEGTVTETQKLKNRVGEALGDVSRSRQRVQEIADRLYGCRPEGKTSAKPEPVPAGELGSLHAALTGLAEQAVLLDEEITRIANLA